MRKQYFTYLLATLVVAMTPVLAQSAPFELHRDVQAASLSAAPIVDSSNLSPLNDVLDDGIDRFYMVTDAEGGSPIILLSKNRVSGRVDVSFDDGTLIDAPLNETFQVNSLNEGDETSPAVGQSSDGGSVMIWQAEDGDGQGVYARIFNADGSAVTGQFVVNTTVAGDQTDPQVAVRDDRSFVVVWQGDDADGRGLYFQRYSATGQLLGSETLVHLDTTGNQEQASVMMADDGSFVVVWQAPDGDGAGIFARSFNSDGQPTSNDFRCNANPAGEQESPAAAMNADGQFVIAWQTHNGSDQGVRAQRYSASAIELGVELAVNTSETSQHEVPAIAMADTGAFTIAWQGRDGNGDGITVRAYDSSGNALTMTDEVVNTVVGGLQDAPDVAMAADGSSLVVWRDNTSKEIHGRRYDANGVALADQFVISAALSVQPEAPCASLAGDGSSYVVMYEARDGNGAGVFALWVPLQ